MVPSLASWVLVKLTQGLSLPAPWASCRKARLTLLFLDSVLVVSLESGCIGVAPQVLWTWQKWNPGCQWECAVRHQAVLWLKVGEQKKEAWQGIPDSTLSPSSRAKTK